MQTNDWDDLRFVLALHRAGTTARAARALRVDATTVARRIKALEARVGQRLFLQGARGVQDATDALLAILPEIEAAERAHTAVAEGLGAHVAGIAGHVRLSAVPLLLNRFVVPRIETLRAAHPGLVLELVPEARALDLSRREADIALRFARPAAGGLGTKAKKLGQIAFAVYAAPEARPGWIGYDADHAGLRQAQWIDRVAGDAISLRVSDAETALEAAAAGLGQTLLPRAVTEADPRLERHAPPMGAPELPTREVWMLSHADQSARASIIAVKDWLTGLGWH